jgi:hypothetical protein
MCIDNINWKDRIMCHGLDWSGSGWGSLEGSFECCNEPSGSIRCLSRITQLHVVTHLFRCVSLAIQSCSFLL